MLTGIRQLRLERGWKQKDLARLSEIPQYRLSLLERGLVPSPMEVMKLTQAFETIDRKMASDQLNREITRYSIEHPHISLQEATRLILRTRPELAKKYLETKL